MKRFSAVCLLSLPILSACGPLTPLAPLAINMMEAGANMIDADTGATRALNTVDLRQPNVTFTFLSTGEKRRTDETFPPPKTIDCSRLRLEPDAFKDAIAAGALVVQIQTPPEAKKKIIDKDGKEITEIVKIKPTYSGALALCKVSTRATGVESRSYHIRDLDDRFIAGQEGKISVIGGKLSLQGGNSQSRQFKGFIPNYPSKASSAGRDSYSWMLWLTDNLVIFPDYEAEVAAKRKTSMPKPASPVPAATKTP